MSTTEKPALDAPSPQEEAPYPDSKYAWYVVGVLMVVFMFSFVDRQILSLLVAPMRRDLQISDTEMSLLMGFSFALFYSLFGIPLGRLADVTSRRNVIGSGLFFWSLATAACGVAQNFRQMFLLRMGVGIGEASLSPSAYSLIVDYFPPHRRGFALGIYSMGIYIGSGLAFILGGSVAGMAAAEGATILPLVGEVRPWQLVFFMVGLPGLLVCLLLFSVREPLRRAHGPGGGVQSALPISTVFRYLALNWKTLLLHNVGFAMLSFGSYAGGSWNPEYFVRVHGWSARSIGLYYGAIVAIFCTAGVVAGGWYTDVLLRRGYSEAALRVGILATLAVAPFNIAYLLVPNGYVAAALLIPTCFFAAAPFSGAAASVQQIMPSTMRGQASSIYVLVVTFIGLGGGPLAVALVTDYVLKNDNALNYSLLIVTGAAQVLALVLLTLGLAPFRQSLERLTHWHAANEGS